MSKNYHDRIRPNDIMTLSMEDRVELSHRLEFKARLEQENNEHSRYYCRHGFYIGLKKKCKWCELEEELPEP